MKQLLVTVLSTLVAPTGFVSVANGQISWTNPATGAAAGDWFVGSNWSTGAVPDPSANVNIDNGGEAQADPATAPSGISVNRIDVGKNGGIGMLTLDGVNVTVGRTLKLGEVETTFAIAAPAVNSEGTAAIQNAALVSIGFDGGGDLDVAQTLASESGMATGTADFTAINVDALRIEGDLDIGETGGTAQATGTGTVTIADSGIISIGMNADIGETGSSAGMTAATGRLTIERTDAVELSGDLDAGRVSSSGGNNTGFGSVTLTDLNRLTTGGSVNIGLAGVSGSGQADSTASLGVDRVAEVAIGNTLGVGHIRNTSATGAATSSGTVHITNSGPVTVAGDVFVGRIFATGNVQSNANGTLVVDQVASISIVSDLDVGQTGTGGSDSSSATAMGIGHATLRNVVGTIQVGGAIDIGNSTAVAQSMATGEGTLIVENVAALTVAQDLNIGQTQGAGEAVGRGMLAVSGTPAITIDGDFDVGKARSSVVANSGTGKATISDAAVSIGMGDGLGDLNVGTVISVSGETARAVGEARFSNSTVQVADRVDLAGMSGGSQSATNLTEATLELTASRLDANSLDMATSADRTNGMAVAELSLTDSLAAFTGAATFGNGASLVLAIGGTVRADGSGATSTYAAIDAASADLAGALTVQFTDDFTATSGDAFELLATTGGIAGEFASMLLPELPPSLSWDVDYGTNVFTLSVFGGSFMDADFDQDGDVDGNDFLDWQSGFGTTSGATRANGDADGDGDVDGNDFLKWQSQFGSAASASSAVGQTLPEPQTWISVLACVVALCAVRAHPRAKPSSLLASSDPYTRANWSPGLCPGNRWNHQTTTTVARDAGLCEEWIGQALRCSAMGVHRRFPSLLRTPFGTVAVDRTTEASPGKARGSSYMVVVVGSEPSVNRNHGFTLVELLVVISIIGMLTALLLPAVRPAREAARRTECINHLKQIGISFHNHQSAHRVFPGGGHDWRSQPTYVDGRPLSGAAQRAGWGFQILPFIEEQAVWEAGPAAAIAAPVATMFCPSRRAPQTATIEDKYDPPITGGLVVHGLCDYAASNRGKTGIVRPHDPVRLAEITDGTTHTLAAADKRLNLRFLGTPQDDDNEGYSVGWNEDTIRRTKRLPLPDHTEDGDGDKRFGSSHPSGINAVFADGSVRSIGFDVERAVFRKMGTKNDGDTGDVD